MRFDGVSLNMNQVTMMVRIKGYRRFRARCFIAVLLIRLAARILGTGIRIED